MKNFQKRLPPIAWLPNEGARPTRMDLRGIGGWLLGYKPKIKDVLLRGTALLSGCVRAPKDAH